MPLAAVPTRSSSFRLLGMACQYGTFVGSDCIHNRLCDAIGVRRGRDSRSINALGYSYPTGLTAAPQRHTDTPEPTLTEPNAEALRAHGHAAAQRGGLRALCCCHRVKGERRGGRGVFQDEPTGEGRRGTRWAT